MISENENNSNYFKDWKNKNKDAYELREFIRKAGGNNLNDKKAAYKLAKKDIDSLFGDESYLGLTFSQYDILLDKIICDKVDLKFLHYKENKNNLKNALKYDTSGVIKELKDDLILKGEELNKLKIENKSLHKKVSDELSLITDYQLKIENLENDLNIALSNLNSKNNKIVSLKENIKRLLSFLPDVDSDNFSDKFPEEELKDYHKGLKNKIKLLQNNNEALSIKIEILRDNIDKDNNTIISLRRNIQDLTFENDVLKNSLESKNDLYYEPFKYAMIFIFLLIIYIFLE